MPKKSYTFRFEDSTIVILKKYQTGNMTLTEALEQALLRLQYLEDVSIIQTPQDVPECRRRLPLEGKYFCIQTDRKGFGKAKQLMSLEICKICKLEKYNLPSKPQEPRKQEEEIQTAIRDKGNQGFAKAGMIYCHKDTLWVFISKCEKCKTPCSEGKRRADEYFGNLHKL